MRDAKPNPAATPAQYYFEPLLTSREAAPYLRVHYKTLEENARMRRVPATKGWGGEWLFRLSKLDIEVNRLLDSNVTNHAVLTEKEKTP
jgi:excisionase family DNA binding protein